MRWKTSGRRRLLDSSSWLLKVHNSCTCTESQVNLMLCLFQVLGAATSVAKHTSALCNACKAASAKTDNPAAKRQFVQAAKDVANNTANLVKNIKVCIHYHHQLP